MSRLRNSRSAVAAHDNGSMMLVFLVLTVVSAMSVVIMATVMSSNSATRRTESFQRVLPRADVGVQNAVFMLNNGAAASLPTSANPKALTGGSSMGSWYVTHPSTLEYVVHSTSTQRGVTRTVTATLTDTPRYPVAAFSDVNLIERGGNSATSYDHRTLTNNTGHGNTGTNDLIEFNGNASADGVTLYNFTAKNSVTRCTGSPCGQLTTVGKKLDINSTSATAFASTAVTACQASGALSAWVASEHDHTLTGGTHCYSSMHFDVDTDNQGTDANPAIIYVTGKVSVDHHVNVNYSSGSPYPNASALQIFVLGDFVDIGNHSNVGAAIWAPHADCGGNPSSAQADIYGAIICRTISNEGGWGFHYDDALGNFGSGTWGQSHYAES